MIDPRIKGPLSALMVPIGDELGRHHGLPVPQKNGERAVYGAFLVTLCGYAAVTFGPYAAAFPQGVVIGWAGVSVFGLLLLVIGARGARGPVDPFAALCAIAVPAAGGWALMKWAPGLWDNVYARGFCIACAGAALVRLWLALRGIPGNAQKIVRQHIEHNEFSWDDKPQRRWWQS